MAFVMTSSGVAMMRCPSCSERMGAISERFEDVLAALPWYVGMKLGKGSFMSTAIPRPWRQLDFRLADPHQSHNQHDAKECTIPY